MINMKKVLILVFVMLLVSGCGNKEENKVEVKSIVKSEAVEKIDNGAILIDVRSASEYASGHIDGAINIDVNSILNLKGELEYNNRNIAKTTVVILYCRSGNRSLQAANKLIELGYTNVYDLGSIDNWG